MSSVSPKASRTKIAIVRSVPSANPTPSTTEAIPTIAIVCVSAIPVTTPSGRRRPPLPLADSSAGSTGSTHGVIAVAAPARTAKASRTTIGS